ncbi:GAF domain-containing sensor histidine kinase [Anaerolineales bacterium HSG25]|nr:GAF domain-containing sensor histidine kinase [Anaerolineales bacterium HSG25]
MIYLESVWDSLIRPVYSDISEILIRKIQAFLPFYQLQRLTDELDVKNKALRQSEMALHAVNQHLSEQTKQLELSNQVGQQIISVLDLDKLLPKVVDLILDRFNCYFVAIWLLSERKEGNQFIKVDLTLQASASQNITSPYNVETKMDLTIADTILAHACHTEKEYYAPDVNVDSHYKHAEELSNTRSQLVLPLPIGKRIIGMLDIESEQLDAFTNDDLVTLRMLTNQIAIAVRNAQLHGMVQQANQDLSKLNADKDKFFSIVAHDLRGPFLPLLGNAELLSEMATQLMPDDVAKMSRAMHQAASRIVDLLENLLQWSQIQKGRMPYRPKNIKLHDTVQIVFKLFDSVAAQKQIKLSHQIPVDIMVYADEHILSTVVRNLVNNALKFTNQGGEVRVSIKLSTGFVEVSVTDTGLGISEVDQAKLFKIDGHHRTNGTANEKGSGLGLIMCKEMVEMHGGQIWLDSKLRQGTTVSFTIPKE